MFIFMYRVVLTSLFVVDITIEAESEADAEEQILAHDNVIAFTLLSTAFCGD